MLNRARSALALLSAVVCVGSALLVGRSFFRTDQAGISIGPGRLWLGAIDAQLVVAWDPSAVLPASFISRNASDMRPALDALWGGLSGVRPLGVGWNLTGAIDERAVLPLWLVPLLAAVAPVRWWRKRRRYAGRGFVVERSHADSATSRPTRPVQVPS